MVAGGRIDSLSQLALPPGFRFYPTDEELLVQYLLKKVGGHHFTLEIIGEIDLYKFDPWVLPGKANFGEKEWYFFSPRDRKYPNGSRPNRVAGSGYWKATGTDKVITSEGRKVGIKKALVFYVGKAPKGTKTNWIMHEYRLVESSRKHGSSKLDEWVLCRIYKKNSSAQKPIMSSYFSSASSKEYSANGSSDSSSSHLDDVIESLPEVDDRFLNLPRVSSLKALDLQRLNSGNFDWATLAGLNPSPEMTSSQSQTQIMMIQSQRFANSCLNLENDVYVPSMSGLGFAPTQTSKTEDEVQSGLSSSSQQSPMRAAAMASVCPRAGNSFVFRQPSQPQNSFTFRP